MSPEMTEFNQAKFESKDKKEDSNGKSGDKKPTSGD